MLHYVVYFVIVLSSGHTAQRFDICSTEDEQYAKVLVRALQDGSYRDQKEVQSIAESLRQYYGEDSVVKYKEEVEQ